MSYTGDELLTLLALSGIGNETYAGGDTPARIVLKQDRRNKRFLWIRIQYTHDNMILDGGSFRFIDSHTGRIYEGVYTLLVAYGIDTEDVFSIIENNDPLPDGIWEHLPGEQDDGE
jgi:hypothetical protein